MTSLYQTINYPSAISGTTAAVNLQNIYATAVTVLPLASLPTPRMKFDPNKQADPPEWATYAPKRKPNWKLHPSRGPAKSAFQAQADIILYHWESNQWVEKCRQELSQDKPTHCEECDRPLLKPAIGGPGHCTNTGRPIWDPRDEFKRLFACYDCRRRIQR